MCRPKRDECDLPEYCTGSSTTCPEDIFSVNGLPCMDGAGYCYNGECPRRKDQCMKMWGSGTWLAFYEALKLLLFILLLLLILLYKGLIMNETDVLSKCFCSLSGAVVADDGCYSRNKQGTFFAYCTRPTNDEYIGCQKQWVQDQYIMALLYLA